MQLFTFFSFGNLGLQKLSFYCQVGLFLPSLLLYNSRMLEVLGDSVTREELWVPED